MARFALSREFYIPKGSTKIADKQSDAVAYVYGPTEKGTVGAAMFYGKQAKPVWHHVFKKPEVRERYVREGFEARRAKLGAKVQAAAERKAWVNNYKVGDILYTSWGYDQTNHEFYEVVEVRGKHVMLRELAQVSTETGFMRGKCRPQPSTYRGPAFRRLAQPDGIRITSVAYAWKWTEKTVAGVPVGRTLDWTGYA